MPAPIDQRLEKMLRASEAAGKVVRLYAGPAIQKARAAEAQKGRK